MQKHASLLIASIAALVLSLMVAVMAVTQKNSFDAMAKKSWESTSGYDERYIALVNRLEEELAIRARFGYTGGKDPMTGKRREVVVSLQQPRKNNAASSDQSAPVKKVEDPVRLTAIIFDEKTSGFTAIIMVNERSMSVGVGDDVLDRKVTSITKSALAMESNDAIYRYDVLGGNRQDAR